MERLAWGIASGTVVAALLLVLVELFVRSRVRSVDLPARTTLFLLLWLVLTGFNLILAMLPTAGLGALLSLVIASNGVITLLRGRAFARNGRADPLGRFRTAFAAFQFVSAVVIALLLASS